VGAEPSRSNAKWSDEQLRQAVASSRSYAQVIRQLGLIPAGGNYDHVQREIVALGLDVTHFEKSSWKHTRKTLGKKHSIELVLVANRPTGSHKLKLRLFRSGLKKQECELCWWAARAPDGRIPLELEREWRQARQPDREPPDPLSQLSFASANPSRSQSEATQAA
jgi:hypothetical protein